MELRRAGVLRNPVPAHRRTVTGWQRGYVQRREANRQALSGNTRTPAQGGCPKGHPLRQSQGGP